MLTYYLYQIFKNNLKILEVFDFFRDVLLLLVIIISIFLVLKSSFKNKKINKFLLFELALTFVLTFVITSILKTNYPHLRPISYFYPGDQFFDSFPSRHTSIAFAISNVIFNNFIEWGIFLFLLSALIAIFSWISFMHWPLDIIIGAFLGFLISTFVLEIAKTLLRFYVKNRK